MKTVKTTTKLFAMAIALVTAATIWFAWGARRAQAIQDSETILSPIGITSGQTARLNVLNSGESKGIIIAWKFLDSAPMCGFLTQQTSGSNSPRPHSQ